VKDFSTAEIDAYAARAILVRALVWVQPRDFETGDLVEFGFSTVTGDNALEVYDGLTQQIVQRNFTSRGAVLTIDNITQVADLTIRQAAVSLSQLNADVADALRGYDMRGAPIQIYRALFDMADPRAMVAPARCRFVGFVNTAPVTTPASGGSASLVLNCVSFTRQLTNTNTALRSDDNQQLRAPGDRFFQWVAATGQVPIAWGTNTTT
jgi:hypothetical protein